MTTNREEVVEKNRPIFNPELYQFHHENPKWMIFKNIAIMTVTFNRLEYTQKLINSIYRKTHLPFTLYILDQASTDGTSEYLDELVKTRNNVIIKKFKKNIGKGRAFLHAKEILKGDLFIHFDNDMEVLSNFWLLSFAQVM
jgi:GT2 family glycosyltransferase